MASCWKEDITAVMARDPAAKSKLEILLCYPGVKALRSHRLANRLYKKGHTLLARLISQRCKRKTGIEIHPGATIGHRLFIDHGAGVVIGETAEIGKNVTLYQGVTLGGTGKEKGKRHPTIGNNVVVASGAKVLGSFKVGDHAKIGAGSVVLKEVPPYATVVGIPGRIVVLHGKRVHNQDEVREVLLDVCKRQGVDITNPDVRQELREEIDVDLDHDILPDPEREMLEVMSRQVQRLEERVRDLEKQLDAAKAAISAESIRMSKLEGKVDKKVSLKKF
ncbi:MAG: serine O-acetyltransferase [Clostridia bacterium]|nr:serine O-acetyltransferase [Clostridia bacterium]